MADQHHGIPLSFSPSSNDNYSGQQLQQQQLHLQQQQQLQLHQQQQQNYAPTILPYTGGASEFYFQQQQQHAPYVVGATVPSQQEAGSSSSKKVRGRPPGSKNKPKPPVFITPEIDYPVKPAVIAVGGGIDVVEATVLVARRRNAGISVLHAAGTVNNVTLCHPLSQTAPFTVHGPFNLLGLSGAYLTPSAISGGFPPSTLPPFIPNLPPSAIHSSYGITLTNPQGCMLGGTVGGKVVASDQGVIVTALLFKNPEYHNIGVIDGELVEEDIDNEDLGDGDHAGDGGSGAGGTGGYATPVFGQTPMGFGVPASGSGGGGLGASGSSMPVFGPTHAHVSMDFSPISMGFGFSTGGSIGGGLGASGSNIPAFGLGLAPTSVPMGFSVPASGIGGGGLGANSSSMPAFSLGLAPTLAPIDYGVPGPNVMHWGYGQPGAYSPNY